MVIFFVKNRRGSITIMLTFMLVAVMSMNTTIIEIARFKSAERMYKEIEETSAFSVLSLYDRDLFENYGLLGMGPEVTKDNLYGFIYENINGNVENANSIENMIQLNNDNLTMDKLYSLAENQVFQSQIREFSAYRAPIDLVNKTLNIEDTLSDLIEKLEEAMPLLESFSIAADFFENFVKTYSALYEFTEATIKLETVAGEYFTSVDDYNEAVDEREDHINSYDPPDPPEMPQADLYETPEAYQAACNQITSEYESALQQYEQNYKNVLKIKCDNIVVAAGTVRLKISNLRSAMNEQVDKYDAFVEAYGGLAGATVQGTLDECKNSAKGENKENTEKIIDEIKKSYEESEKIFAYVQEQFNHCRTTLIDNTHSRLQAQSDGLANSSDGMNMQRISKQVIITDNFFSVYLGMAIELKKQIEGLFTEWGEAISILKEMIDTLKFVSNLGLYNYDYNNIIDSSVYNNLPGKQRNERFLVTTQNAFAQDEIIKNNWINSEQMQNLADNIQFETDILGANDASGENEQLVNAMEEVQDTWYALEVYVRELTWVDLVLTAAPMLVELGNLVGDFIKSIINLVTTFIDCASMDDFTKLLYQKLYASEYAVEMFSNRLTDVSDDKRLNGSDFSNYAKRTSAEGYVFDMANTEYIIGGTSNEISNQESVFKLMLCFRIIANIPAVFGNEELRTLVEALTGSVILIVVAIVIVVVVFYLEAWLDMFFLLNADTGVDVVKITGWLDFADGTDNLVEQLKETFENTAGAIEKMEKASEEKLKAEASKGENQNNNTPSSGDSEPSNNQGDNQNNNTPSNGDSEPSNNQGDNQNNNTPSSGDSEPSANDNSQASENNSSNDEEGNADSDDDLTSLGEDYDDTLLAYSENNQWKVKASMNLSKPESDDSNNDDSVSTEANNSEEEKKSNQTVNLTKPETGDSEEEEKQSDKPVNLTKPETEDSEEEEKKSNKPVNLKKPGVDDSEDKNKDKEPDDDSKDKDKDKEPDDDSKDKDKDKKPDDDDSKDKDKDKKPDDDDSKDKDKDKKPDDDSKDKDDPDGKKKEDNAVTKYAKGLLKWDYKDHMMLLMMMFVSSDKIYARCADLIEMDLKQAKKYALEDEEFKLANMYTYLRVESTAEYTPVLPVPTLPGLKNSKFKINNFHYSGY